MTSATGSQDQDPDKKGHAFTLCRLCTHASCTTYSRKDPDDPWKEPDVFEDFDCNSPNVRKYNGCDVLSCDSFDLWVDDDSEEAATKTETKCATEFQMTLIQQKLQKEIAELRAEIKDLKK